MTPIHQLLSRIRHDPEFGKGEFEIGYFDRFERTVHRVALRRITFQDGQRRAFELVDEAGQVRRIPLHRIREVRRNGKIIWRRLGSE